MKIRLHKCARMHHCDTCATRAHEVVCIVLVTGGRCTNNRIDPTLDNPKLCHAYWLLNRLSAIKTNTNDVI